MQRLFRCSGLLWLACLLVLLVLPTPVSAISNPNSITIGEIAVFRNIWSTGDLIFFMRYNVYYASTPTEDASNTFQMAIYDTDGVTLGPTRALNYYQHNIISIYLTPAQVITYGYAWSDALYVRVMGMPSVFTLVEGTNMRTSVLVASDYRTLDFGAYLLTQAEILQASWGITLLSNSRLNTTGANYFKEAIPGLAEVEPDIFMEVTSVPGYTGSNMTKSKQTEYSAHKGPRLQGAMDGIGGWLGTSGNWFAFYALVLVFGIVAGGVFTATKRPEAGLLMGIPLLAAWAWLGLGTDLLVTFAVVGVVVAILFGIVFIIGRFSS